MFQPKLLFLGRNNMIHHLCAPSGESGAVECVYIPEQVFPKMALPNTLLKKTYPNNACSESECEIYSSPNPSPRHLHHLQLPLLRRYLDF